MSMFAIDDAVVELSPLRAFTVRFFGGIRWWVRVRVKVRDGGRERRRERKRRKKELKILNSK